MAKHNDMPELNSAKVFSTNLFTKEHLKPPCQQQLTTASSIHPHQQPLQLPMSIALAVIRPELLQVQHGYRVSNRHRKIKALCLTAPGYFGTAAVFSGNGDMNGFTIDGLSCNNAWLKDEPAAFARNI